ncbi:MAG: peptide chain release factor N(5)-glutamine methyltransferase [Candidatus Nitrospinota bacterium M3_3B_026]
MTQTLADLLAWGGRILEAAGVESFRLDSSLLLAHALGVDRGFVLAHAHDPAPEDAAADFEKLIARRTAREPLAYITGEKEFYSLSFHVTPAVLIPRPETETLVDAALALFDPLEAASVLDVGTGSGAIAVTLALHAPRWKVRAVDSEPGALAVAGENARRLGVADRIDFAVSDLFSAAKGAMFDIIVTNPPYVPEGAEGVSPEVAREPHGAVYAGPDGLDVISRIIEEAPGYLREGGCLVMETGGGQSRAVSRLVEKSAGLRLKKFVRDLAGAERALIAVRG